jgi:hypothetical protein
MKKQSKVRHPNKVGRVGPKPLFGVPMTSAQLIKRMRDKRRLEFEALIQSAIYAQKTTRVLREAGKIDDAFDIADTTITSLVSGLHLRSRN